LIGPLFLIFDYSFTFYFGLAFYSFFLSVLQFPPQHNPYAQPQGLVLVLVLVLVGLGLGLGFGFGFGFGFGLGVVLSWCGLALSSSCLVLFLY
jgi:hypothetical protein